MRFSERLGFTKVRDVIQAGSIDAALRNSLWNVIQILVFSDLDGETWVSHKPEFRHIRSLWLHFFKLPLDDLRGYWPDEKGIVRKWFFQAPWYEIYDVVEFIAHDLQGQKRQRFIEIANSYLERELSGFRFVDEVLTRVTTDAEVESIEAALHDTKGLLGVHEHLSAALVKLGDRANPDYRNAIKESICAVESLCRLLAVDPNATLGGAVRKLRSAGVEIHPALEKAWSALYGYTSDRGGIRHAMLDEASLTQADAKYMLVSCSAFVSYLTELAAQAGITFEPA